MLAHEPSATTEGDLTEQRVQPIETEIEVADSGPVRRLRFGKGGTALGIAVHATLQTIDLATLGDIEVIAALAAVDEGIADRRQEVATLARRAAESAAVREAVASARMWHEVPVGAAQHGVIVEGVIDVLYQRLDGSLGIIDYKTDQVSALEADERMVQYRSQGGAYALAAQLATGIGVSKVEFVFASLGQTRTIQEPELAELVRQTEARLSLAA